MDELAHPRPGVVPSYKFRGLVDSKVSGEGMVVIVLEDP